ncbi:MAG: MBL fold metallo-hydrolase [Arenicellales bacterium WSBS_2016_MAG_OTU3]
MPWYSTQTVGDGVTLILEAQIDPGWRCNIWHVRGRDGDMLVDSGMGIKPIKAEVALVTEKPLVCVATHAHFDHIGGHHEFDQRVVHEAEAEILAKPTQYNTVASDFLHMSWYDAIPENSFNQETYAVKAAPATRTVVAGDTIDLGDRCFEVKHFPGHSPGSICLWEAKTRTLFSGDVMYDGELLDGLYHSDKNRYVESLHKLREMPVETVRAGHFDSFGRARLHELIDAYLRKAKRVD